MYTVAIFRHCLTGIALRSPRGSEFTRRRAQMLRDIGHLLNDRVDPHLVVELVNKDFKMPPESRIDHQLQREMEDLCDTAGWRIPPGGFSLFPLNSPAALLHWRDLAFLLGKLSPDQQDEPRTDTLSWENKGPTAREDFIKQWPKSLRGTKGRRVIDSNAPYPGKQ